MKRPFMGMGIALAVGVAAGWFDVSWYVVCLGLVVAHGISIAGCIKKYWTDRTYKYVIGLSVFFIVGFCRAIVCSEICSEMEARVLPSEIVGTVEQVQEKTKVIYVFVQIEDGRKALAIVKKEDCPKEPFYKGQIYQFYGEAKRFESASNPGQFNELTYYRSQGVEFCVWAKGLRLCDEGSRIYQSLRWIEDMKHRMQRFYEQHLSAEGNGILQAAVLGERSALDSDLKRYYQENGWMHLITTSGLHLSFIAMSMYKRMRKLTLPILGATAIAFGLMFSYGYMTNFGDSMLRAMGMMILTLIAKVIGRRTDGWTSLSLLASLMLFVWPGRLLSSGFWLTYAAIGGMEWGKWLAGVFGAAGGKTFIDRLKQSFWIQVGIFVMTLPILLWTMYEIPVFGFFYNFFMIPLISWIVPLAFAAGGMGCLPIPLFQWIGSVMLKCMDFILKTVHILPSKVWTLGCPKQWQMCLFVFGLLGLSFMIYKGFRRRGIGILLISCCLFMFVRIRSDEVIFMDVGQGDGICLLTKEGHAFLIDGGSSSVSNVFTYRLEPLLKYYGVNQIDGWFVTHSDQDHVSGLLEALEDEFSINQIYLPDCPMDDTLEDIRDMAQTTGISVKIFRPGDCLRTNTLEVKCLYPALETCTGEKNNDSMVVSVKYGLNETMCHLLMTGDLEMAGESVLLEQTKQDRVDILKVAHHGSSGGTGASFLESIQPKWGIISCGKENRYGHPHKETLERLETANCLWVTTASRGAVFVCVTSKGYEVSAYEKQD